MMGRIRDKLGYRGLALVVFGLIYVGIGVGVIASPDRVPHLFHTYLPIWLRVGVWSGAGMVAAFSALHSRWQVVGFAALFIGPAERFLSYGWALVSEPQLARLAATAIYLLLVFVVLLLASWPEPPKGIRK